MVTNFPFGNLILYTYDSFNVDIFQRGNLTQIIRAADGARADGHGGLTPPDIVAEYVYEPLYTQQRTIVDPTGQQSEYFYDYQEDPLISWIDISGPWQINMAGIATGLGDLNGDSFTNQIVGNPVVLNQPDVTPLPGGLQESINGPVQPIRTRYRYNDLGQIIVQIDAEGNVTTHRYHPEVDPDGDGSPSDVPADGRILDLVRGGYLARSVVDDDPVPHLTATEIAARNNATNPTPAAIANEFFYDRVGNLIRSTDGNGTDTVFEVNQLGHRQPSDLAGVAEPV